MDLGRVLKLPIVPKLGTLIPNLGSLPLSPPEQHVRGYSANRTIRTIPIHNIVNLGGVDPQTPPHVLSLIYFFISLSPPILRVPSFSRDPRNWI